MAIVTSMGKRWMDAMDPKPRGVQKKHRKLKERPGDILQLNDSVWQLYTPERGLPEIDIVLFHGLSRLGDYKDAFWKTWLSRDESVVWPRAWLSEEFPQARILAIAYDGILSRSSSGVLPGYWTSVGEDLVEDVVLNRRANVGEDYPVVLIGHSLGCSLMQQFLLSYSMMRQTNHESLQPYDGYGENKFWTNLRGVFYYSKPWHEGSKVRELASVIRSTSRSSIRMKNLTSQVQRINSAFDQLLVQHKIKTRAIGESSPTQLWGFNDIVVPATSGTVDGDEFSEQADHFNICRSLCPKSESFQFLVSFIEECAQDTSSNTTSRANPNQEVAITLLQRDGLTGIG